MNNFIGDGSCLPSEIVRECAYDLDDLGKEISATLQITREETYKLLSITIELMKTDMLAMKLDELVQQLQEVAKKINEISVVY